MENEQSELSAIVHRLIAALPDREREVLHLRDSEGLEFEHIAEIVGSTEAAVRMACSRARSKVKEELIKIMNYGV
jgi:RNA polymerase sigma-70 factor (ECF subfamily)